MSTYSENRLITGKKSFTFLKSNVILLKLQKEEKKINRHLDCSKSSPQFRASHKNSLLSLPDKTDAANQSRTIEGVYTIQYVDSSLVYNWYVIIRLGCTHSGTLASNCVRHIDSTELLCKTPSNICSEMLRELRRKPEILILILQVLHSKLLHGSRAALRFRPRVPKASILNDDQGIFVLSFWLFLHFISVCGFSQQKHGCPLTFKEHPFGKRKNLWIHCGKTKGPQWLQRARAAQPKNNTVPVRQKLLHCDIVIKWAVVVKHRRCYSVNLFPNQSETLLPVKWHPGPFIVTNANTFPIHIIC